MENWDLESGRRRGRDPGIWKNWAANIFHCGVRRPVKTKQKVPVGLLQLFGACAV